VVFLYIGILYITLSVFFICDDYVAEVLLCHFLQKSSCVSPILAADALCRVVCNFSRKYINEL
jgi:hypothetical protein